MQLYLGSPVRFHVYSTTVGFQQRPLPWLSDLKVGVNLCSYLQSFTAAPFQLYSADWLCQNAAVPEGLSGQTKHCYSDPDFLI